MGKGELDKAKESTAREEEFRGLVGTWKDENWREIRHGEIRARERTERRERRLKEENEELKRFYLIEKQTFTSRSIIVKYGTIALIVFKIPENREVVKKLEVLAWISRLIRLAATRWQIAIG